MYSLLCCLFTMKICKFKVQRLQCNKFASLRLSLPNYNYNQRYDLSKNFTIYNLQQYFRMTAEVAKNLDNFKQKNRTAFVLGYTGEVGKALVDQLKKLNIFRKVTLIGRREVPLDAGPEFEQKVVDFEKLEDHSGVFQDIDVGFCCLGTTRSKAGVKGFIKVDHDYVVASARVAKIGGCKHFLLVSSQGANKDSSFLYTQVKGKTEEALKDIKFDHLSIFRPAFLMCNRVERRPMESVVHVLLKPFSYLTPTFVTVPVTTVAAAMINNVVSPGKGSAFELFDNKDIHHLASAKISAE